MKKYYPFLFITFSLISMHAYPQMYILNEDFNSANGTTPPAEWSNTTQSGTTDDLWHFENMEANILPVNSKTQVSYFNYSDSSKQHIFTPLDTFALQKKYTKDSFLKKTDRNDSLKNNKIFAVNTLNDSLIAYYPFNGNANDESANENNGIVIGATLTDDRFGNPNSAYYFDGDDYINIGDNNSLKRYTDDYTISAWIKINVYSSVYGCSIISNRNGVQNLNGGSKFGVQGSGGNNHEGSLDFSVRGGYSAENVYSQTILLLDTWYYVTMTYKYYGFDNNTVKLYINGVQVNTDTTIVNTFESEIPTFIGYEPFSPAQSDWFFNGIIDDIRIYKRVLNLVEIDSLYHLGGWDKCNEITFSKQINMPFTSVSYGNHECANFVDVNNDQLLDIFFTGSTNTSGTSGSTSIYINNDNNNFTPLSGLPFAGFFGSEADWADYNNDGYLDLLLSAEGSGSPGGGGTRIYKNNGNNTFTEIIHLQRGHATSWGDYNNDGKLDFAIGSNTYYNPPFTIKIYKNEGNDIFTHDTSISFPVTTSGYTRIKWVDYNNDHYLDLMAVRTDSILLYKNNGDNTFTKVNLFNIPGTSGSSSLAFVDYNNDGLVDIFKSDNKVYINNAGDGTFLPVVLNSTEELHGGNEWGDYNNDGFPDMLMSGNSPNLTKIYKNEGGDSFKDIGETITGISQWSSVKWGDYNNDGFLDFLIAGYSDYTGYKCAELYKSNAEGCANTAPSAPSNLQSSVISNNVTLNWEIASDVQTSNRALTYNIRVGKSSGSDDILSAQADLITGFRKIPENGNVGYNNSYIIKNLEPGTYYWSVQSIDQVYTGSLFSNEKSFTISNPDNSLVAYYPFNGNANDESGNEYDGIVKGATLTTDRFDKANCAYEFDGELNNISSTIEVIKTGQLSLSLWYKPYSPTSWYPQLLNFEAEYLHLKGNHPYWTNKIGEIFMNYKVSTCIPEFDKWHYICAIWDSNTNLRYLYIDGVLNNTFEYLTPFDSLSSKLFIGNTLNGMISDGDAGFIGKIDDIRIYKIALTQQEVDSLYHEGDWDSNLVCNFTGEQTLGNTPLTVHFSDLSSGNPIAWKWDFENDGIIDSYEQNPSYTYTIPGKYSVLLIAENKCFSDTIIKYEFITVDSSLDDINVIIDANNVFTPNGDGLNDYFEVRTNGIRDLKADIYNQWGNKAYEITSLDGKWDGNTNNGDEVPEGVYYYIIEATGFNNLTYTRKGSLMLLRDDSKTYPNPVRSKFTLKPGGKVNGTLKIAIYNAQGDRVYSGIKDKTEEMVFDIFGLKKGIYLLKVCDGTNCINKKIVKE